MTDMPLISIVFAFLFGAAAIIPFIVSFVRRALRRK